MMKKIILILSIFYFLANSNALAAGLTILTEDLPPMNYKEKEGKLVGPAVKIVREILKILGSKDDIIVYPWKRAVRLAENKDNVVLFSMEWTRKRDSKFKWIGPIAEKKDVLVAKKCSGFKIKSWEDIKYKRIGTIHGDVKHDKLKRAGCKYLEPVSTEEQNIKKLDKGRIDLWIYKNHRYINDKRIETNYEYIKHNNLKNIVLTNHESVSTERQDIEKIKKGRKDLLIYKNHGYETVCQRCDINYNTLEILPLPKDQNYDERSFLFIAFSKKTADEIVQRWKYAFNKLRKEDTLRNILEEKDMKLPDFEYFEKYIKNKPK